eukprot:GHVN01064195.1.p4 GENE.GHVN01064195.1~~GHVN01064195.1.p4  ORF type:complete len:138 (+),score=20.86 GHVN01064195.1:1795-2208(+)
MHIPLTVSSTPSDMSSTPSDMSSTPSDMSSTPSDMSSTPSDTSEGTHVPLTTSTPPQDTCEGVHIHLTVSTPHHPGGDTSVPLATTSNDISHHVQCRKCRRWHVVPLGTRNIMRERGDFIARIVEFHARILKSRNGL